MDDEYIPIPKEGVDFASMSVQPTAEEFFILSRLDGSLSVRDLCKVSGLGETKTKKILERLLALGLIVPKLTQNVATNYSVHAQTAEYDFEDIGISSEEEITWASDASEVDSEPKQPEALAEQSREKTSSEGKARPVKTKSEQSPKRKSKKRLDFSSFPISPESFPYDEELLTLDVDIEEERKKEILFVYGQLEKVTYYQLFGLESEASRKEIRTAYFRFSKCFHPDLYFRRELLAFRPLVERIFQYTVKAYETLSNAEKREEYDRYLKELYGRVRQFSPTTTLPAIDVSADTKGRGAREPSREQRRTKHKATPQDSEGTSSVQGTPALSEQKREAAFRLLVRRGQERAKNGNVRGAAHDFRNALRLKEDVKVALTGAKMLCDAGQKLDDAAWFAKVALKQEPDNIEVMLVLGRICHGCRDYEQARHFYQSVLQRAPESQDAVDALGRLQRDMQETAK